jgi:translation initiation factor 2 subunit 1
LTEEDLPEEGELVVVTVQSVKNFGAFVTIDEYGGREGFVHVAEVASGWVKYIRDFIREGQKTVCKVIKVDAAKGQVDLSLKRVTEHQKREKVQAHRNMQRAEKLLELALEKSKTSKEEWYEKWGNSLVEETGGLYEVFEMVAQNPALFEQRKIKVPWTKGFIEIANDNITPPTVNISGVLFLSSNEIEGVDHIREALAACEKVRGVKVQVMGAPADRVSIEAEDYKKAEEELKKATTKALEIIKQRGGTGEFKREAEKA